MDGTALLKTGVGCCTHLCRHCMLVVWHRVHLSKPAFHLFGKCKVHELAEEVDSLLICLRRQRRGWTRGIIRALTSAEHRSRIPLSRSTNHTSAEPLRKSLLHSGFPAFYKTTDSRMHAPCSAKPRQFFARPSASSTPIHSEANAATQAASWNVALPALEVSSERLPEQTFFGNLHEVDHAIRTSRPRCVASLGPKGDRVSSNTVHYPWDSAA